MQQYYKSGLMDEHTLKSAVQHVPNTPHICWLLLLLFTTIFLQLVGFIWSYWILNLMSTYSINQSLPQTLNYKDQLVKAVEK
jgi:hypothetical protein